MPFDPLARRMMRSDIVDLCNARVANGLASCWPPSYLKGIVGAPARPGGFARLLGDPKSLGSCLRDPRLRVRSHFTWLGRFVLGAPWAGDRDALE